MYYCCITPFRGSCPLMKCLRLGSDFDLLDSRWWLVTLGWCKRLSIQQRLMLIEMCLFGVKNNNNGHMGHTVYQSKGIGKRIVCATLFYWMCSISRIALFGFLLYWPNFGRVGKFCHQPGREGGREGGQGGRWMYLYQFLHFDSSLGPISGVHWRCF